MKAILEFSLPEEQDSFKTACNAVSYSLVLWDLDQFLRGKIKYEPLTEEKEAIYQELRDKLHELANEHEVSVG